MSLPTARPRPPVRHVPSAILIALTAVAGVLAIAMAVFHVGTEIRASTWAAAPVEIGTSAPAWSEVVLPCIDDSSLEGGGCEPSASGSEWPASEPLPVQPTGDLRAGSDGSSWVTQVLALADVWSSLLFTGLVTLTLVPVLRSITAGRPFAHGNAARLGAAAALTATGALAATLAPYVAAHQILDQLEDARLEGASAIFTLPDGWLAPSFQITWWPLLVAALLTVLALATRAGARLAHDHEGLV